MRCGRVRSQLSAYLDRQLPAREDREVETHLHECSACQRELAAIRFTSELLSSLPAPRLPRDLAPSVVALATTSPWPGALGRSDIVRIARRSFIAREVARAAALATLVLLTAAGPKAGRNLLTGLPMGIGHIAEMATTRLGSTLVEAGELLRKNPSRRLSPMPSAPAGDRSRGSGSRRSTLA